MKLSRKMLAGIGLLLLFSMCAYSQNAPLTKDTVIQMVKAGLPDDVIISKIKSEPNLPNLSADDLIALKTAGASDAVIRALLTPAPAPAPAAAPAAPAAPPAAPSPAPAADPDDPMAPHDPGIYLMTTTQDGKRTMVFIDRVGAGREKSHRGFVSSSMKAEIPGPRAAVRTATANPVFYMYFPPSSNIGAESSISSPTQFSLLALDDKKDHRETAVAKVGMWGSISLGNDAKKTSLFNAERIHPYAYKVSTSVSLKPGEYAFIATTTMAGSAHAANAVVIYDFGIDGGGR